MRTTHLIPEAPVTEGEDVEAVTTPTGRDRYVHLNRRTDQGWGGSRRQKGPGSRGNKVIDDGEGPVSTSQKIETTDVDERPGTGGRYKKGLRPSTKSTGGPRLSTRERPFTCSLDDDRICSFPAEWTPETPFQTKVYLFLYLGEFLFRKGRPRREETRTSKFLVSPGSRPHSPTARLSPVPVTSLPGQ